jgi:hypothetical protein
MSMIMAVYTRESLLAADRDTVAHWRGGESGGEQVLQGERI